jgi:hypothetical protein
MIARDMMLSCNHDTCYITNHLPYSHSTALSQLEKPFAHIACALRTQSMLGPETDCARYCSPKEVVLKGF